PIDKIINFKLATLIFKAQTTHSPTYLATLLQPYIPYRSLRSLDQQLLQSYHVKTNFGSRAFRFAAPIIWNSLPFHIRSSSSLNAFKSALKTFYFQYRSHHHPRLRFACDISAFKICIYITLHYITIQLSTILPDGGL